MSDRKGHRLKPDWILDRTVGVDQVWRKPDWNTVHLHKPYYRIKLGAPWSGITLDTGDKDEVEAVLLVCSLLRDAEVGHSSRVDKRVEEARRICRELYEDGLPSAKVFQMLLTINGLPMPDLPAYVKVR